MMRGQRTGELHMARQQGGRWTTRAIVACVLVVLLALGALCGFEVYRSSAKVTDRAKEAVSLVDELKSAVKKGDAAALAQVSEELCAAARSIRSDVHSPAWYVARLIPVLGSDVHSVQVLSDVVVDLADNALSPVVTNPSVLNYKDIFSDGKVDLAAVRSLSDVLGNVAPVFERCAAQVESLPEPHMDRLKEMVPKLKDGIVSAGDMVGTAQALLPRLSSMLGGQGTKNYLVVAFTNAELRSAGGFPGSWTLVTVTDGKISMGKTVTLQHKADDFISFQDDEVAAMPGVSGNMASIPFLPDFPHVGKYMAEGYEYHRKVHIDGVIAIDPVFLQRVLALTGGVTASDGTLVDGTNAAWELMSNAYWRFGNEGKQQDAFFAEVASLSFDKLMHSLGTVSFTELFSTLSGSAADHRLQVWMEDEALQEIFASLGFAGEVSQDVANPELGLYLNDNTWAKIGWYTKVDTLVGAPEKNADGSKTYEVVTTITNSAWEDELAYSPRYVWGYNWDDKRTDTDMVLFPLVMAPAGGSVFDMRLEGHGWLGHYELYGRDAYTGVCNVDVGESLVLRYRVTVSSEATSELTVRKTPLAQERLLNVEYAWE